MSHSYSSLFPVFSSLKSIIQFQKDSLSQFSQGLHDISTQYGSIVIDKNNLALKNNLNELKKNEKELIELLTNIAGIQGKYYLECKSAENCITEYENTKTFIDKDEKISLEDFMNKRIKIAKDNETSYLNAIDVGNTFIEQYNKSSLTLLKRIKALNKEVILSFENALQLFYNHSLKKCSDEKQKLEELKETLDKISYSSMLENKSTFCLNSHDKFEFMPYQIPILESKEYKETKDEKGIKPKFDKRTHDIIVRMKKEFKGVAERYDDQKENAKYEIYRISKFIVDNIHQKPLDENDKTLLYTKLKLSDFRLQFLRFLNSFRASGKFVIGKQSFIQLGHIMKYMVDRISEDKDYESMRYLLIMCQTYYYVNKEKKKFYLAKFIEKHQLFQADEFWEFYFSDSIFKEIEKSNKTEEAEVETQKEKDKRFSNVVFSKLLSIAHNMMDFQIDKKKIQNLILVFSKQYSVDESLEKQIVSMIDEIVYEENPPFDEESDLTEDTEHNGTPNK